MSLVDRTSSHGDGWPLVEEDNTHTHTMHQGVICIPILSTRVCRASLRSVDRASPFATPAALHFASCLKRFGAPITCLNLVKVRRYVYVKWGVL